MTRSRANGRMLSLASMDPPFLHLLFLRLPFLASLKKFHLSQKYLSDISDSTQLAVTHFFECQKMEVYTAIKQIQYVILDSRSYVEDYQHKSSNTTIS